MNAPTKILLVVLVAAVAAFAYSLTPSGATAFASLAGSFGGLFVNRGIRNCNPGNLRNSGIQWDNMYLTQAACEAAGRVWDPDFCVFYTMSDGVRALGHDLSTAVNEGYDTLSTLIPHYAPPTENDTAGYVAFVQQQTGWDPATYTIATNSDLPTLTAAVMLKETGYTDDISNISSEVYAA